MDYKQACQYAKGMVNYYTDLLPVISEYLYIRTCNLFLAVIFDEIELYFVNKTQSSMKSNTEYGVCALVCDIFANFIKPIYMSLLLHKITHQETYADNSKKGTKKKKVQIDTDRNQVFIF